MTANAREIEVGQPNGQKNPNKPDSKKSGRVGILSYIFLPGIIPQIQELTRGGFGYLALLIANVYQAVRILPSNHPYTQFENKGTFGIRQVIIEAANNVQVNKKNLDQVIIFGAVLVGLIILFLQLAAFVLLLFSGDAWAASDGGASLFRTENPKEDIAFHMMREVFGVPEMFGETETKPIHSALHALLHFYNMAILLVAVLVFLYYVIVVVGETAQSGTPFGQRFSHVYAPFRLVIAIGLLVPLNYGINGAQWITLYSAKVGSGFATNGWTQFINSLTNPLGAENATLIAETKEPDFQGLVNFMAVAVTCKEAYRVKEKREIKKFCRQGKADGSGGTETVDCDGAAASDGASSAPNLNDIKVIFGAYNSSETGELIPYCGTVTVPITVPMDSSTSQGDVGNLQKEYMKVVDQLWNNAKLKELGTNFANAHSSNHRAAQMGPEGYTPTSDYKQDVTQEVKTAIKNAVKEHYEEARNNADFKMREDTKKRGWGGAGIWYNRIAQINGAYVVATMSIPAMEAWPEVMDFVLKAKQKQDGTFDGCSAFEPNLADNKQVTFTGGEIDRYYAKTLNNSYKYWHCEKKDASNFFIDALSAIFGLEGLMKIRDRYDTGKTGDDGKAIMSEIHPLAKLSALGRGLVEAAVRNMGMAMGSSFFGGMVGVLAPHTGASLKAASGMFVSIATIGLSIGFITYYILPFLPFMYFFFAVGGWVKGIFEAMVGAPLWALAHLRIDGDGLPGKMAMNGYFLILEIFLRPILTVFGLLGGMAIFTALATILNDIFNLVVLNTGGVDLSDEPGGGADLSRHVVDKFFFTCVYAVILYMMAVSSFKMINLVPNNILRWIGQNVSTFNDQAQDPTQGLTQYAAIGGARIGGQLAGGMTKLSESGGGFLGGALAAGKTPRSNG